MRRAGFLLACLLLAPACGGSGGGGNNPPAPPAGPLPPQATAIPFRPIDAEYNRTTDKIVAVSAFPHRLNIYDPVTHANTTVGLPATPTCVSVGPDGTHAAVGHDGWISYVDLGTATLEKTVHTSTVACDIVLAGNGFVYVMPAVDQWQQMRCIQLSPGTETLSTGYSVRAGSFMKLHPGGTAIYAGNVGLSPSDIERYDIGGGTAAYGADGPYHGTYESGGPIWMQEDGLRLFTRAGTAFRTLSGAGGDMEYNGALSQTTLVRTLDHRTVTGKIAAIPGTNALSDPMDDTEVQVYTAAALGFDRRLLLPPFRSGGKAWASHGRFAFIHGDGDRCFVLVQADRKSGLNDSCGIVEVSLTGTTPVVPTGVTLVPSPTLATVTWDKLPMATGYNVYWATSPGVQPGNYASLPNGGTMTTASTSTSTSALPAGATIYVVVTAVTAAGEGPPSPEASVVLESLPTTPLLPTNVTAVPGNGQVTLTWTASPNATSYVVYGSRRTGIDQENYGSVPSGFRTVFAASPAVVTGLENDQPYYLRVAPQNASGEGYLMAEFVAIPTAAATPPLQPLTYRVIDAEYSRALNRIVSVSASPSMLHLYNPLTQTDTPVALSQIPKCVSVSPDGLTAVVGHDGTVTHVDLQTATVLASWSTSVDAFDIVLAGNGKAYINPAVGQWVPLYAVTLSSGAIGQSGLTIRHQSNMKLHAAGTGIYSVTTDSSPSDIEKWNTSLVPLYDSSYHGDFPMGGPLWTSMDGAFLITSSATRFSTTGNSKETDLKYEGRLYGLVGAQSVDHSTAAGRVAAVPREPYYASLIEDDRVQWFDDLYGESVKARMLPRFDVSGTKYAAHGKFAFFSSDGTKVHVVVMADVASGLLNDYAVVTFD